MVLVIPKRKKRTISSGLIIPDRITGKIKEEKKQFPSLSSRSLTGGINTKVQTTTPATITKNPLESVTSLGIGLGKGILSPLQTAKTVAESFVSGTPASVAGGQRGLSRSLEGFGKSISFLAETLNLPGQIAEAVTKGKIQAPKLKPVIFNQISSVLETKANETQKLAQTLNSLNANVVDERALEEKLKDPKFIYGDLIGQNLPNLLISAGLGVAGTAVGGPVLGSITAFTSASLLEGGFAINEAIEFINESDNPRLQELKGDKDFQNKIGLTVGLINGILETIPIANLLKRNPVGQTTKRKIIALALRNVLEQMTTEGGTEGLQEIVSNAVATIYDEDRDILQGVAESFIAGSLLGGGASVTTDVTKAAIRRVREATPEERQRGFAKIPFGKDLEPLAQEATIIKQAKEDYERAESEVFTLLELSKAGERLFTEEGVTGVSSTFPAFISPELRSKKLFNRVVEKIEKGIELKGSNEIKLKEEIEQAIFNRMDTELANEKLASDFIQELETKKDTEANAFVKEIEQGIIDKLTSKRFSLVQVEKAKTKAKAKGVKEGVKIGAKETRQTILTNIKAKQGSVADIKQQIVDYARAFLTSETRGKLLATIKNAKTFNDLENAKTRMSEIGEKTDTKGTRLQIQKELSKIRPPKQAGQQVGKFTPFIQKVLDGIKEAVKLTEEQADIIVEKNLSSPIVTPEMALQNKILSLYSGLQEKDSVQLQKVLDSIIKIKEEGRTLNELNKFNVEEDIARKKNLVVNQSTGGKGIPEGLQTTGKRVKTFTEKGKAMLKSLGAKWVMSWRGLMNIVDFNAGVENQKLAELFSVLEQENEYKQRQHEYVANFNEAISSAYGIKNKPSVIGKKIIDGNKLVKLGEFTNSIGQRLELEFTKAEMMKMYAEFQDPTLTESFEKGNNFTEEIKQAIEDELTKEDKAFANAALKMWQGQYQEMNPVFSKMNGIDLPQNDKYSPIKRFGFEVSTEKGLGEFIEEATYRKAVSPSATKTRVKTVLPIAKQSIYEALDRHFTETNYYITWAEKVRELDSVFKDSKVRFAIEDNYTKNVISAIDNTINDLSTRGNKTARRYKAVDFFRKHFTVGALMIKLALTAKQYVSTIAYYEVLTPTEFATGVIDFWKNPIKNARILNKESILIKQRGSDMERDIKDAVQSDVGHRYSKYQSFMNAFMLNVRLGDKGAILTGSWAIRKARLAKGASLDAVINEYETFSSETQQSADLSQSSEVQRGGSFEQLFTMFKSSQRQYFAKEVNAVKSLFQKGGTSATNIKKVAKTMIIYHVILPVMFQYVSNFGGWDEDDKKEYLQAGILGSLNGIFLLGDILGSIIRTALGLRVWDLEIPITAIADDINRAVREIDIDDITIEDMGEALLELSRAGNSLGVPVEQTINIGTGIKTLMDGDIRNGVGLILGWSSFALQEAKREKVPERTSTRRSRSTDEGRTGGARRIRKR